MKEGLTLLKDMMNIFETEMDCDGYGIKRLRDVPYHFIIEDYNLMGWDYVHGAKRFIEYFFSCLDVESDGSMHARYPFTVECVFKELPKKHLVLLTGEEVDTPRLDLIFMIKEDENEKETV